MQHTNGLNVGVMFRRENAPEVLPDYARRAEQLGFNELWIVEDCFYASGLASAAVALACTRQIRVGLGIMPAVARNSALTAMEIATLARIYPQRFLPGLGHGVTEWMKQIGAFPKSQLIALGETTEAVRYLLAGEDVTYRGKYVRLDAVKLEFPPESVPPVSLGVRGPKSLALSGRSADGTILAELASPAYVRWAREQIALGQAEVQRESASHRVTVYMFYAADADGLAARRRLRPLIATVLSHGHEDYLRPLGIEAEVSAMRSNGGRERLAQDMPDAWIEQMAVVGTPDECADSIRRLLDAGADSVVLIPEDPAVAGLDAVAQVLG